MLGLETYEFVGGFVFGGLPAAAIGTTLLKARRNSATTTYSGPYRGNTLPDLRMAHLSPRERRDVLERALREKRQQIAIEYDGKFSALMNAWQEEQRQLKAEAFLRGDPASYQPTPGPTYWPPNSSYYP